MLNKNKIRVNATDKNLGATNAGTVDMKSECRRQLYDTFTYTKSSKETKEEFIRNVKFQVKSIVEKHLYRGSCFFKEAKFLLSCTEGYKILHFYSIWKFLKTPPVRRPMVAGYNGFLK